MKAIHFPQANTRLAESQPEYETLYAHLEPDGTGFITKFQLNDDEVENVIKYKTLWYHQKTFGKPFHPMYIATDRDLFSDKIDNDTIPMKVIKDDVITVKLSIWERLYLIFGGKLHLFTKVQASGHIVYSEVKSKAVVL